MDLVQDFMPHPVVLKRAEQRDVYPAPRSSDKPPADAGERSFAEQFII